MPDQQSSAKSLPARPVKVFQPRDFAWLLFVAVLIAADPETNYNATIVLILIGAFQIAEPRLSAFSSRRGQIVSIVIKMLLSYLLVGWTHTIDTVYYLIFLIPIISAAAMFNFPGVIAVTAIASLAYFSFLLPIWIDWNTYQFLPGQISVLCLRISFFAIVAYVVYEQAKAKRDEMVRTQEAAERLAESNRSLRRAEASLRRSERLAALGQLTAGLAHELRNPLGTIKASAEMLTKDSTKSRPEVMSEMAGYIGSEVDRMNGLVSSFLDFARPLQVRPVAADLREVIEDVVRQQTESANRRGVTLSIRMSDAPLFFVFDPDLLKVAIGNLVQNAIQASAPGQEIEVRAELNKEDVLIFVSDHGAGIQPQHLENIFNPFFTTKPQGVGLGLAIVAKIVDEHQGRIHVFSEPGAGTRFEMMLPRTQNS
ncbi:MAG: GHKL domain-containing protein [Acidobacteriaceae bacterium]|nr:GHKL domain-containing protein [Acidobacteriaceae bacterium]